MDVRPLAVSVALFLALMACADAPVDPGSGGGISHSTAADHALVKVAIEGGFTPVEWTYTNLPTFSLFGDGTLVVPGAQIEIYPGPALPALSTRRVEEPGIQAILVEALDAIRDVPDELTDLGSMAITDVPTTAITVATSDVDRTIRVYALAELTERPDGMPQDEFRARLRLQELVTELGTLATWVPEGSLGEESTYSGSAARLYVGRHRPVEDLAQDAVAWPLDVGLGGFGERGSESDPYRCGVLDGADWATVRSSAGKANELTPWTDGHARFTILFRPLLPDENGC